MATCPECLAATAEVERLRAKLRAVEALLDEHWMNPVNYREPVASVLRTIQKRLAALADVPAEQTPVGQEEARSREFGACGGCGATWPDLHVYSSGLGGVLCVKCGWTPPPAEQRAEGGA
jgi:hypothetical protein